MLERKIKTLVFTKVIIWWAGDSKINVIIFHPAHCMQAVFDIPFIWFDHCN
jgi:hypothetical protein